MDEIYFVSPPDRDLWKMLGEIVDDEDPDLAPAEDVIDDIILFEVGF